MGGVGAAGRGLPPALQGSALHPASDRQRHPEAARERSQVALAARRSWALVDEGLDIYPLGGLSVWERLLALAQERDKEARESPLFPRHLFIGLRSD
jgi:hypothetical protein